MCVMSGQRVETPLESQLGAKLGEIIRESLYRILSLLNRNVAHNKACGSFDRTWWAWRMKDMPNMSLQHGVYPLTLAYRFFLPPFNGNESLRQWIIFALGFWCRNQHKNGSFDQVMPHEYSVGTTSYTLGAVLESERLLGERLPSDLREELDRAIEGAAAFLLSHEEKYAIIANHVALFAWVFMLLYNRNGDDRYHRAMKKNLERLLDAYIEEEGWFQEYEGADPGYQTQCLSYLARICKNEEAPELLDIIKDSLTRFLIYFFHPDGTFGGNYGARSTEIIYPGFIFYLADKIPEAQAAACWLGKSIVGSKVLTPVALDDENVIRLTAAYLHTFFELDWSISEQEESLLPCYQSNLRRSFPRAGLEIIGSPQIYTVLSVRKGGVLLAIAKSKDKTWEDVGYTAILDNGQVASSHVPQHSQVEVDGSKISLNCDFLLVSQRVLTPLLSILLRMLNLSLLRLPWLSNKFKAILVQTLITGKRFSGLSLKRDIEWDESKLIVTDTIRSNDRRPKLRFLWSEGSYSVITMAAADFAHPAHLMRGSSKEIGVTELNLNGLLSRTKVFRYND